MRHDDEPETTDPKNADPKSDDAAQARSRRAFLRIAGLTFLTAGFANAMSPVTPRAGCGSPHGSGVGYTEDNDPKNDQDCGLVTSNPRFGGRGGAAYHDNDCGKTTPATEGQDNDCGKLKEWALGGHKDSDCGLKKADGTYTSDQDCNVDTGAIPNGGWEDHDCGKKATNGEPASVHKDSNDGYDDDEDCTFWDSNCTWFDNRVKPKRGDDPLCLHVADS